MTATPLLDQITVARFTLDDFPLTDEERDLLMINGVRFVLEEHLREVVDFEDAAARALEVWRGRRT